MTVLAIVQARMSSSRLPGKVLLPLANRPVLWHVHHRLQFSQKIDKIVIATSSASSDDPIETFCKDSQIECFRGSLDNVLDRFYQVASLYKADHILRITADCPAIDPAIVDEVISGYFNGNYARYGLGGEFPDGLDCTIFSFEILKKAFENATLPSEKEHVEPYMTKMAELYKQGAYEKFQGLQHHRWTLDEPKDYELLKNIFNELFRQGAPFSSEDILGYLENNPSIFEINQCISRNEGYSKSLKDDEEFLNSQANNQIDHLN